MEELMYTCELCNKEVTTTRSYMLDGKKVCRSCQLNAQHIRKYGSLEAYRESKRLATEKTCRERYGASNVSLVKEFQDKKLLTRAGVHETTESTESIRICSTCGSILDSKLNYYDRNHNIICKDCSLKLKNAKLIETYGSLENYNKLRIDKGKLTNLERYGVENPFQSDEIKTKIKETNLERLGVDNPAKSEVIKSRIKATNLERYGTENPAQNQDVQAKIISTSIDRYGTKSPLQSDIIKDKIITTNLERYGVKYTLQADSVKEKIKKSYLETEKAKRNDPEHIKWRISVAESEYYNLSYISQRVREDGETEITYRCNDKGHIFTWCQRDDTRHPRCPICAKDSGSIPEVRIRNYLQSLIPNEFIKVHDRTVLDKKELDLYIPSRNLAIEYDGIYWHNGIDNYYKYETCKSKGIRLIQITEYEWWNKRNIVCSILKSMLGKYDKIIYARKCEVRLIDTSTYTQFMEGNHLQGPSTAAIRLGLYYNGELVQVESYSKPRYSSDYDYELIRECSKLGYHIVGGKSKLFKYFIRNYNPKSIVSYCEKNKFSGDSYLKLGFKLDHESGSGYRYYKNGFEYSRITFQKYKMPGLVGTLLDTYDPNLTEIQNMDLNGYFRLYDYGNYVFLWTKGD